MQLQKHENPNYKRFEARITLDQKELFQHAASLLGKSLNAFVVNALQETAKQVIKEHEIIRLSAKDQRVFVQALLHPDKPNAALLKAVSRYKKEIK